MKAIWIVLLIFAACSGSDGLNGERGADGEDGVNGQDGAPGPQGEQGEQGAPGEMGMDGMNGLPGTACWDLSEDGVCDIDPEDKNGDLVCDVLDCIGDRGPEGPRGEVGADGPKGDAGPPGPQGPPGTPGADGDPVAQCGWVSSAGCALNGSVGSTCTTTASCPMGQVVIGGGCDGFTSVAIGRSLRTASTGWQCYYRRISEITGFNTIRAQAFCCP